jgi:hypothetical protein
MRLMGMFRRSKPRPGFEAGATVVELAIAMIGLGIISMTMMSFFVGATSVEDLHKADDLALEQIRDARARLSRDVREARRFTSIGQYGFTVWIDQQWDNVIDVGELVTWGIDTDGALFRSSDGSDRIEARGLLLDQSRFTYDSVLADHATMIEVHLVVGVDDAAEVGGTRSLDTEVSLRNVP